MIKYIVTLASGFMDKFNQHKLYTEQTVSQQIVLITNFIGLHILSGTNGVDDNKKIVLKKERKIQGSLLAVHQQLQWYYDK